jgi:hypothetical protein
MNQRLELVRAAAERARIQLFGLVPKADLVGVGYASEQTIEPDAGEPYGIVVVVDPSIAADAAALFRRSSRFESVSCGTYVRRSKGRWTATTQPRSTFLSGGGAEDRSGGVIERLSDPVTKARRAGGPVYAADGAWRGTGELRVYRRKGRAGFERPRVPA